MNEKQDYFKDSCGYVPVFKEQTILLLHHLPRSGSFPFSHLQVEVRIADVFPALPMAGLGASSLLIQSFSGVVQDMQQQTWSEGEGQKLGEEEQEPTPMPLPQMS